MKRLTESVSGTHLSLERSIQSGDDHDLPQVRQLLCERHAVGELWRGETRGTSTGELRGWHERDVRGLKGIEADEDDWGLGRLENGGMLGHLFGYVTAGDTDKSRNGDLLTDKRNGSPYGDSIERIECPSAVAHIHISPTWRVFQFR